MFKQVRDVMRAFTEALDEHQNDYFTNTRNVIFYWDDCKLSFEFEGFLFALKRLPVANIRQATVKTYQLQNNGNEVEVPELEITVYGAGNGIGIRFNTPKTRPHFMLGVWSDEDATEIPGTGLFAIRYSEQLYKHLHSNV